MKKIILLSVFAFVIILIVQAQYVINESAALSITGVAKDSTVNTSVLQTGGDYPVIVSMGLTCTPASGDPRLTYAIQGSIDGTQYFDVSSTTATIDSSASISTRTKFISTASTYYNGIYMPYWRGQLRTSDSTATAGYEVDINLIRIKY